MEPTSDFSLIPGLCDFTIEKVTLQVAACPDEVIAQAANSLHELRFEIERAARKWADIHLPKVKIRIQVEGV